MSVKTAAIIFDIILIGFAIYTIVKFSINGFLRSLLDLAKMAVALALASLLRAPLGNLFSSWIVKDITDLVRTSSLAIVQDDLSRAYINISNLTETHKKFLTKHGLDLASFNSESEALFKNKDVEVIESLSSNAGNAISNLIASAFAFVLSFIVLYIIISLIVGLIKKSKKFEKIKPADRVFGVILGIAFAIITMWKISQSALFVVYVLGPHVPEFIDPIFAEKSFVIRMCRHPYVVDDILRNLIS